MNPEGRLHIRLQRTGRGVAASIHSTRPLNLPTIFRGKSADELLQLLPMLYRVCGIAQATAAYTACGQALGIPASEPHESAHSALVWTETAREHLWRMVSDWSRWLEWETDPQAVAPIGRLVDDARHRLFPTTAPFTLSANSPVYLEGAVEIGKVLTSLVDHWVLGGRDEDLIRDPDVDELMAWIEGGQTLAAAMLRRIGQLGWSGLGDVTPRFLPADALRGVGAPMSAVGADEYIARPLWESGTAESSALSRRRDHPAVCVAAELWGAAGLETRLLARLAELVEIAAWLRVGCCPAVAAGLGGECGIASVEAARGLLVHRVCFAGGRIADYRILAPTEWNFHPAGVAVQALGMLDGEVGDEVLRSQAEQLIGAIDPCVGYELSLE